MFEKQSHLASLSPCTDSSQDCWQSHFPRLISHSSSLPFSISQERNCAVCAVLSRSVVSDSSQPHGLQPTRLLRPWDFPGKSTGVGCHCLLWINGLLLIKNQAGQNSVSDIFQALKEKDYLSSIKLLSHHHQTSASSTCVDLFWAPLFCFKEKAMAPNSSTLAWKIPWTEEPGGLQSMGSLRVGHD